MAFPATLTLVTVTIQIDLPPTGGATGWIDFTAPYPLQGTSVVPPFVERAYIPASGSATIQLPAINDPQWTPQGWAYTVTGRIGSQAIKGTLQLDYQSANADFAALFQPDGAATAGQTYIPLSQRSVAGGVAALDVDGDVVNAAGAKITGGGGGGAAPSSTVVSGTSYGATSTAGVATAYSRGDHSHGTPALGTTSTTAAAGNHTHTGVYDPAGTASTAVSGHTAASDPHPQYTAIYLWNGSSYDIVNGAAIYVGGTGPASPVNGDVLLPSS